MHGPLTNGKWVNDSWYTGYDNQYGPIRIDNMVRMPLFLNVNKYDLRIVYFECNS